MNTGAGAAVKAIAFIQDGNNLVTIIDKVTSANTLEALEANSADLVAADRRRSRPTSGRLEYYITGTDSLKSPVPTLMVPTPGLRPERPDRRPPSGSRRHFGGSVGFGECLRVAGGLAFGGRRAPPRASLVGTGRTVPDKAIRLVPRRIAGSTACGSCVEFVRFGSPRTP